MLLFSGFTKYNPDTFSRIPSALTVPFEVCEFVSAASLQEARRIEKIANVQKK
jgi:hypothetical protein